MDLDANPNISKQSAWASRRKAIILSVVIFVLVAICFFVFWVFWHKAPTCFDGQKNGDEIGIDCGGSCDLICTGDAIFPIVRWDPRMLEISPGIWSIIVYVENPNTDADAVYAPYTFVIYGENNEILFKKEGATILPKNKTVGIFEGSISIKNGKPRRSIFELGKNLIWQKNVISEQKIEIGHSSLMRLDSEPRIEAVLTNQGSKEIKNIELVAAVFDGSDNVIAASRTFVENLNKGEKTNIFFTWPKPFKLGTKACEKSSSVMLLLDRSGSMSSASTTPPEPLSTAKAAASYFIDELKNKDQVGVISFANEVKNPIDYNLSSNFAEAKMAINSIAIQSSSTQYTNFAEALHAGWQELISPRSEKDLSKIIVLLTDGIATAPKDPQSKSESDDLKYAENSATQEATNAKKDGITIYTIGLGSEINQDFLENIASQADNYFFAPSAADLKTIYKKISSDICEEVPARIEITYKIFGNSI